MAGLSAQALLAAVERGDPGAVLALLRGQDEAARRAVAPAIKRTLRHEWGGIDDLEADALPEPPPLRWEALLIAALGTLGLNDLSRAPVPSREHVVAVLMDRRPAWVERWAEGVSWYTARALVRAGLCPPQRDDDAIERMLRGDRDQPPPVELVREDPALLEDEIWRLFEVEGRRESNLTTCDWDPERGWNRALRDAERAGRIDRARLLDATLEALTRDFGGYRNRWYTRLHTDLEPTLKERVRFAGRYLDQLRSPHAETAAWAMDRVDELDREHPLDASALLPGLAAVVTSTRKRTVTRALRVLERVAAREPARAGEVATVASEALVHEAPDIQARALRVCAGAPEEALERFREVVAPTNRAALEALIGDAASADVAAPDLDALASRIAAVAPAVRAALDLDAALAAARDGRARPLPPPPLDEPRLDEPVVPIETPEELAGVLIDWRRWADEQELERVLDAIARFCGSGEPPAPVLRLPRRDLGALRPVLHAWASGATRRPWSPDEGPLRARLDELAHRCARGESGQLLATPTHRGGWIDPRALVARAGGRPLDLHSPDTVIALLRLAPEHRDEAIAAAVDPVLRCALGGPDPGGDAPALVAARLTRLPPLLERPRPTTVYRATGRYGTDWHEWEDDLWADPPPGNAWTPWRWLSGDRALESAALVWPNHRDLALVARDCDVGLLLAPGEPISAAAAGLLGAALQHEEASARLLAVDVAAAAIGAGRLDAALLAGGMAPRPGDWAPGRLARSLTALAAVSTLHAETVREALDRLLARLSSPEGVLPILTLLNELCADACAAVEQRAFLESLTGASKTTKTAKALLARTGGTRHPIAALALEARIGRAERWTARR